MSSPIGVLAMCLSTLAFAEELPLACSPSQPVVDSAGAVSVQAWPPSQNWSFTWTSDAGVVTPRGETSLWDLRGLGKGVHKITVRATRPGSTDTTCIAQV